ncbi:MFS general substrate transporter [Trichoderma citrinoviride]|uniref:MFS general substrate transporter n=1 Tax=Trichoderma citrinoviride TaxID=58853 RepID=A0A2T4B5X4_9HYPO|nr:MFS general substrate transporter [Trichoderma citrinoviride]PTB64678.1 MFS general substrate transporter [Trichoderma citrinoviride]
MEAYRQYTSLGKRLEAQLQRNRSRPHTTTTTTDNNNNNNNTTQPPHTNQAAPNDIEASSPSSPNTTDLEDDSPPLDHSLSRIGTNLAVALTGIVHKQHPSSTDGGKVFVVGFEGPNDPLSPRNWSLTKRMLCTLNVGIIALVVGMAASIDSAVIQRAAEDFGVSEVAEALATGLFLAGFGFGALIAGPLSETVGRNPVYFSSLAIYMLFLMGAGLSKSLAGQLVCRFFAGLFGESPLSTVGGSISDLWNPTDRLVAFPMFATAGLMGPVMGPIVGGWISQAHDISWRWTEWVTIIVSGTLLISLLLFQPETYEPILLQWKASHLRRLTGDSRYVSAAEIEHVTFRARMMTAVKRPFIMAIQEPTIMLWTGYLTVVYLMLFGFLDGYTFVFQETYGLSDGITGTIFVGIGVGLVLSSALLTPLLFRWAKQEMAKLQSADEPAARIPPEFFLWYALIGAPAIPVSFFWMGWTAYPHVSIWSPIVASVLFGFGMFSVFVSTYMYLIDTYEVYAASALTMITLVRYVASGGMIEISIPMYKNLGIHWALTMLGLIALVFTAVPYAFFKFGPWIRSKSRFAKPK